MPTPKIRKQVSDALTAALRFIATQCEDAGNYSPYASKTLADGYQALAALHNMPQVELERQPKPRRSVRQAKKEAQPKEKGIKKGGYEARMRELRNKGKPFSEIAKILNKEGYRNSWGRPLKGPSLNAIHYIRGEKKQELPPVSPPGKA
jgi:hypothetical protein